MGLTLGGIGRSVFFHFSLFFSTYLGSIFIIIPNFAIYPFHYPLFRRNLDFIASVWFHLPISIYEIVYGVELKFTGDSVRNDEKTLLLLNHRTYFDWLFFWSWVLRFGSLAHEKIVLKSVLKFLPGAGWAMQTFLFLFVNRKWELDKPHMEKLLQCFVHSNYPLQLLIFPEGTDMDKRGKARSDAFAQKNGLPIYNQVLHPRTTGFVHSLNLLRGHIDAVYDISVAYQPIPKDRNSLLRGEFPREIHFNFKRYPIQDLPKSDEELSKWLLDLWAKKEATLEQFYKDLEFKGPKRVCASNTNPSAPKRHLWGALIFWQSFIAGSFCLLYYSSYARWYFLFGNVVFLFFSFVNKGFDSIEINQLFKKYQAEQSKNVKPKKD